MCVLQWDAIRKAHADTAPIGKKTQRLPEDPDPDDEARRCKFDVIGLTPCVESARFQLLEST